MPETHIPHPLTQTRWPPFLMLAALLLLLAPTPIAHAAAPSAGAMLSIPALNIHTTITQAYVVGGTWDVSHLKMNVAHLYSTAWIGEGGNIVLGGHSETPSGQPEIFYNLDLLQPGDQINLSENGLTYHYTVIETRLVAYTDVGVVNSDGSEKLTLLTCALGTYDPTISDYRQRLIVTAIPSGISNTVDVPQIVPATNQPIVSPGIPQDDRHDILPVADHFPTGRRMHSQDVFTGQDPRGIIQTPANRRRLGDV